MRTFHQQQYRPPQVTVIAVGNALEGGHAALADSIEAAFETGRAIRQRATRATPRTCPLRPGRASWL